ncbi:MAG: roadblock/LC7 domain-containing protein [Myxococcota bacterium]|jgi:predicted regulator of Ras-like GTPase activity (Roadblock/LC7/MglB family)|nr:roadblock/LC7 domain-containing protein [Myxococcota bacterium]
MSAKGSRALSEAKEHLAELVERSGALTALLITRDGTALVEAGDTGYLNTTALAALVAGMFTATREVARIVGEQHFSILLQQGETRHIHISLVTESAMLVVVFEDYQRIGRVRHEARKSSDGLAKVLAASSDREMAQQEVSLPEFKEYALNLIDRIFETR